MGVFFVIEIVTGLTIMKYNLIKNGAVSVIEWDNDSTLTHYGLVTPHGDGDLGQHRLR